jgi:hypothetical protein
LIALFWAERDSVEPVLKWLRLHGLPCAVLATIASALLIARRRSLKRSEYALSWLAAVPATDRAARWESLVIETLPAIAAIGVLGVLSMACALVLALAERAEIFTPFAIEAYLSGGIAAGIIGSYLVPQPKPVMPPPGSRYVPHQRVRGAGGVRPSLRALGAWPIRQMFAWAQPKIVSRASIPILVMMPMGTTADAAMVAIALFGTMGALLLLCSAVIAASRAARSWLAPLPARRGVVIGAFLLPVCAVIVAPWFGTFAKGARHERPHLGNPATARGVWTAHCARKHFNDAGSRRLVCPARSQWLRQEHAARLRGQPPDPIRGRDLHRGSLAEHRSL